MTKAKQSSKALLARAATMLAEIDDGLVDGSLIDDGCGRGGPLEYCEEIRVLIRVINKHLKRKL